MDQSTSNQKIRFILGLIWIAIIIITCDWCIGKLLKKMYFSQGSGVGYRTTYSIDSTMADVIVFGSSRANHHYVTQLFEDNMQCSFYNAGRDGNYILYSYAVFKAIINRYYPKLIIYDINPEQLRFDANEYDKLSLLMPYYQTHPEIRSIINLRSPYEKFKSLSSIYPYNSLILQIMVGNLNYNKERAPDYKGYVPSFKSKNNEVIDTLRINPSILDENKISAIKDIFAVCKENNISIVFVYSPIWRIVQDQYFTALLQNLCLENEVEYINLSCHPLFISHPEYFSDKEHLNDKGAREFSNILSRELLKFNKIAE